MAKKPKLKNRISQFMRKPWITKILERWLCVAKTVPYKFPNDIPLQLSTLHVINGWFILCQNTRMPIAQTLDPEKKKLLRKFTYKYTSMTIYGSKFQNLGGGQTNFWTFWHLKNRHFSAHQMANWWLIQKSKLRCVEYPLAHLWTDSWWNQSKLSTL